MIVLEMFLSRIGTRTVVRLSVGLAAGLMGLALAAGPLWADDRECPSHPDATYTLSGDPDSDKSTISRLTEPAKQKGAVCILAFYDGQGPANSKMLAMRRANWVMEQFNGKGVTSRWVLRAADKSSARMVQIILGP